jgi:hypothetical protein
MTTGTENVSRKLAIEFNWVSIFMSRVTIFVVMTDKTLAEHMSELFGGDEEYYEPESEIEEGEPEFEGEGAEKDELPFDTRPE